MIGRLGLALLSTFVWAEGSSRGDDSTPPAVSVLKRTTEPLLKADRPWEDFCLGYCQVLKIGDEWRLWYTSYDHRYRNDSDCYFCYARSKDGVHWKKPSLGLVAYKGVGKKNARDNNIVALGYNVGSVFFDEQAPPAERFKALAIRPVQGKQGGWWVYGGTSADGIRWTWTDEPLLKKNSDTANVCIHDGNVYRLYVRMWSGPQIYQGHRLVGYTESATFGAFPDPVAILKPDKDDPSDFHYYNSAATKLKDNLYLMLPSGLLKKDGTVSVYAAFSRDGKHFHRLGRTPLLGLGKGFDSRGIYVAPGAIPGEEPGTYWFYYNGVAVPHNENAPSKVHGGGGVGRFLLRVAITKPGGK